MVLRFLVFMSSGFFWLLGMAMTSSGFFMVLFNSWVLATPLLKFLENFVVFQVFWYPVLYKVRKEYINFNVNAIFSLLVANYVSANKRHWWISKCTEEGNGVIIHGTRFTSWVSANSFEDQRFNVVVCSFSSYIFQKLLMAFLFW